MTTYGPPAQRSDAAIRPTPDEIYLADRISERHESDIGPALIVKLNKTYGIVKVTSAMRILHGFPPLDEVRTPAGYLQAILKGMP